MKKSLFLILCVVMVTVLSGTVSASSKAVSVVVNKKLLSFPDAKPYVEGSRVMIPVRFVSEALGAKVDYKNKTVLIDKDGKNISMKVDSKIVLANGKKIILDVPVRIKENRTFVPLRFVSEALNAKVEWNVEKYLVSITTSNSTSGEAEPDSSGKELKWGQYTELGKVLFKNNMRVANEHLIFTMPENAQGILYKPGNGNGEKLIAKKNYSLPLGENQGYIMLTKIYSEKDYIEGYAVYLDVKSENLDGHYNELKNDAVVSSTLIINGKMEITEATLTNVIKDAVKKFN
ncbi:copper amine oxidase N-terminal domain-containing protein [Paenibacillus macquariensis]|uniref:Copper amine oxidase N-terminal domain-containing protein n=1 Tax=Paenibacillus macquariensis TaxID=948756 RepID=A0ABY1KEY2_9BACL|nr:copper amine oxidase N-terminal domain-containing protein [Paenibacillus macquariensis]OAB29587.1 hypothetical protein PMSM_23675 [Paenibacillus macquariensis subsp. macquariensis]SIR73118.1 Copper amine oxidase N-terminal domain-containing protein [Paenibacillus macquariensis]